MTTRIVLLYAISLIASGMVSSCASIPSKVVTLIAPDGPKYVGRLDYSDGLSGVLTVEDGPNGESFSGEYVVDRTTVNQSQGKLVIPGNTVPAIGASAGNVDASGFWYAMGDKDSIMLCTLAVGRQGHGYGTCKHSNGKEYKIVL
jgi:hypothetical protein